MSESGRLSIVATPIGNLGDASSRMQDVLSSVDVILAEDSRRTGRLLSQFGVNAKLMAFHEHNERELTDRMLVRLLEGSHLALVSDAGTPTISDPGFRLIREAHAASIRVEAVPGPSAVIAALSVSGLPTDRFCFEGFLPNKSAARIARLRALEGETRTLIFFESVHRIVSCVEDCIEVFGATRIGCIARELTKKHEQVRRGDLGQLKQLIDTGEIVAKGEFVVLIGGAAEAAARSEIDPLVLVRSLAAQGVATKVAAKAVAEATGASRNELYRVAINSAD
ncbi:MAG: 16S rRNA (cytidine(1402)-2'-O)-methyltransferase [Pseudomonadota bacterium]